METHFFLFRHGQTTYNANGYIQGQTNDSVLTDMGIKQAYEVGNKLKQYPIEVILCSPLKRTKQTAQEVLKHFNNVDLIQESRFIEVNVGEIEGLYFQDVVTKYGAQYHKWRDINDTDLDFCFKGGESKMQVRNRAFEALEHYLHDSTYKYIAVATHGILLAQICAELKFKVDEIKNGAILHLLYQNGEWQAEFL